ncbi:adenylate/guanylate cyclase domain-containing protein [Cypionkella sp. TWP1-2-1b2]|uniref:adenylate/guanylate cyclase domain-containing protein n=1 Tax=Cypionkella sp. TWP1-2-1b2 TaxID=2804675 RepID=UPI003CEEFE38
MNETRVQRRLSAVLVADIVGYSLMVGADEKGTVQAVKNFWANVLTPLVAEHAGRIIKFMGDGVLIEFQSAVDAVECALRVQDFLSHVNETDSGDHCITLRIGINLGDLIIDGDDIFGEGVNVAARLESLARIGELCIAANVYDAVRGKLEFGAEDLGPVQLKNISEPVRIFRVFRGGARLHTGMKAKPEEVVLSIAVLPFDNMSAVPEHGYIGDGIAENIITDLSRFRDISVIARNSSFAYKGKATRVQDIRRDLGVNYVLEGSIQKTADRIRITAQLIEGVTGKHLWAERYDRQVDDIFGVMDEITQTIVGTLATTYGGRLRKSASERSSDAGPTSFTAFDHFVQGMQEVNKFTEDSISASINHFKLAIQLNPRYAKAHAKLAWAYLMRLFFGWTDDEADTLKKSQDAANRAIWADESEAWAHWAIAGCALLELKHDLTISRMLRAVELNPNDADILTDMAAFCSYAGRADEGIVYALKGMRINPHYPEYYADQLGQIYFDARQYEDAIRTFQGIRSLKTPSMLVYLAASYAALGQGDEALKVTTELLSLEPQSTAAYWAGRTPYKLDTDRDHLATNLCRAGLPH